MARLRMAERTLEQLKALAASGSSGLARAAQAELKARTLAALRQAVK